MAFRPLPPFPLSRALPSIRLDTTDHWRCCSTAVISFDSGTFSLLLMAKRDQRAAPVGHDPPVAPIDSLPHSCRCPYRPPFDRPN
jgi:hypothetical protein